MKNNNVNWWLLISIVIVVAVIVSAITAGITGNVIKLNQDRFGKFQVYTKAEVDEKFQSCNPIGLLKIGSSQVGKEIVGSERMNTCKEVCDSDNKYNKCFIGFISTGLGVPNIDAEFFQMYSVIPCKGYEGEFPNEEEQPDPHVTCVCCK